MDRALRDPARDPALRRTTSPTGSTCAATSSSTRGSTAATFDDATQPLDDPHRPRATRSSAQFLIMATGCLSSANIPDIPGLDAFAGDTYHTGRWPHEGVDFTGKRVGVIGTGSSAIQSIPIIAEQAARARTCSSARANFSVPAAQPAARRAEEVARSRPTTPRSARSTASMPTAIGSKHPIRPKRPRSRCADDERERVYEARWEQGGCRSSARSSTCSSTRGQRHRGRVRPRQDPRDRRTTRRSPSLLDRRRRSSAASGCASTPATTRRSTGRHVDLVDVSETPISEITPHGHRARRPRVRARRHRVRHRVRRDDRRAARRIDIRGRDGQSLREQWAAGPRTYLGLGVAGFPNLFTISGPGSPSVLTNMIVSIEQHVELDRRLHRVPARQRASTHRSRRSRRRTRGSTTSTWSPTSRCSRRATRGTSGANVPGQAARVHAAARLPAVRREVRRGRRQGLRGIRPVRIAGEPRGAGRIVPRDTRHVALRFYHDVLGFEYLGPVRSSRQSRVHGSTSTAGS